MAIRLALMHARVGPGDEVLIPAYNCPSMVEPIEAVRAIPRFYGIRADLTVDVCEVERGLTARTRAILVPHFFANLQDLAAIRSLCSAHRAVLIEDCAHAFFGVVGGAAVGSLGDYTIASPRKFFAIAEGGMLTSATHDLHDLLTSKASFLDSARKAFEVVDAAVMCGRLPMARAVVQTVKALRRGARTSRAALSSQGDGVAKSVLPPLDAMTASTRVLLARLLSAEAIDARRAAYRALRAGLDGVVGVRPIALASPDLTVPYMLPVVLGDPEIQFPAIKESGVPVWRWEYSQRGYCRVTDWYAQALIQVPCHQALSESDIERIVSVLRRVARLAARRRTITDGIPSDAS